MFKKIAVAALVLASIAAAALWFLSAPSRLDNAVLAAAPPGDAARGEQVFFAGGCASCHAAPDAAAEQRFELGGGVELATPFGTFVAPNISPHPEDGIGGWDFADFANAMMRGVSPGGRHYFPAFPYTSYARMEIGDVADLFAYLGTLPAVAGDAPDHRVGFPFNVRRGVGLWKLVNMRDQPVIALDETNEAVMRGRYLVEGPGHCGECHTPRDATGGPDYSRWLAGGPAPEGEGSIPNITPGGGIGDWSELDIANYLESGFTPDFDSAGGEMAAVVRNMAELDPGDREAIAAYLKAIPAH